MIGRFPRPLLCAVLAFGALSAAASADSPKVKPWTLYLKVGDKQIAYESDQLLAMASAKHLSNRETKTNPAVPIDTLVMKDTGLTRDRILKIVFLGATKTMLLEGKDLDHLGGLLLKLGPNNVTLVPKDEKTYEALRSQFGRPRVKDVERIYVYERR
ncbi:MAG: hypothetical protein ACE5FL_02250 [Myxococcota bacterium]